MNKIDNYINMLVEFHYKKNGKELSIAFLEYMLGLLKLTKDSEWNNE